MFNNCLEILENSRVVIPEKRENQNKSYNHPSILLGSNIHTEATGKRKYRAQRSTELRKQNTAGGDRQLGICVKVQVRRNYTRRELHESTQEIP